MVFVLCAFALTVIAMDTYAQNTRITLKLKDTSIKETLTEIENKTQIFFLYNNNLIDVERKINIDVKDENIIDVVDILFAGQNVEYTLKNQLIILFPSEINKQQEIKQTAKGKVVDRRGEPLPGVTVVIKGTDYGTVTDFNGNFSIEMSSHDTLLYFSYIGMESQSIVYSGNQIINVVLEESNKSIDEVIVVAYGMQSLSTLTGSIQSFDMEKTSQVTSAHVSSLLQSMSTGALVVNSSGAPGEKPQLRIRGEGSINFTNEPLWVVDGVIFGTTSPDINPNDIENISILKDAAAAALYGSRASNGVILIQTKTGELGTSNFYFKALTGVAQLNQGKFSVMNGQELFDYVESFEGNENNFSVPDANSSAVKNGTNWQDIAFKTGIVHDYNLSYRGGIEKSMVYASLGYFNEEGAVLGHKWEKFSGRVNLDYYASDKVKLTTKIGGIFQNSFNNENGVLYGSYLLLPWDNPYFEDGSLKVGRTEVDGMLWYGRDQENPLYNRQYNYIKSRSTQYMTDLGLEIKLTDWLKFTSNNRLLTSTSRSENLIDARTPEGQADQGSIYNAYTYIRDLSTSNLLRFDREINKHHVFCIAAYEYSKSYYDNLGGSGKGIYPTLDIMDGVSEPKSIYGTKTQSAFLSILSNAHYVFDNKYMAKLSFRRDGSSRFGANQRFGNFYSVGVSWTLSNEDFMNEVSFVDNLKFRASYGSVGNANISDFVAIGIYNMTVQYNGEPGGFPRRLPNPDLTWESNKNSNIAVDARLFQRVNLTVDVYNKKTENLLQDVPMPLVTGFYWFTDNIGSIQNRGLEVNASSNIFGSSDFNWNTDLNISFNKNKVLKLNAGKDISNNNKIIREGWDINTWYMRKWAGVDPGTGNPLWEKVTENGDGRRIIEKTSNYSLATFQKLGSSSPKFFGGFNNTFTFREFSFITNFNFVYGNKIYHSIRELLDNDGAYPTFNAMKLNEDWSRWENPGDIATHPKAVLLGNKLSNKPSSRYLEDGSYIRLRHITLTYDLPKVMIERIGLKSAKMKLSGENLWTSTNFSGMDPEVGISGYAGALYAVTRKYVIGLDISF